MSKADADYKVLYLAGGAAALLAGLIFRRNLGPEASILTGLTAPATVAGWFTLLQDNLLLGVIFLNAFDIVDYALVGLMFLAVCIALRRYNKSLMTLAAALGFTGLAVYFASNTALSMLSLSGQYAAATSEAQKSALLAAGQAVMAFNPPGVVYPGAGNYLSFLLLAAAGLIVSLVMLQSAVFGKVTACAGIAASALDLACCVVAAFQPVTSPACVLLIASAGLFLMVWHVLAGIRLVRLGREAATGADNARPLTGEANYG